MTDYSTFVMYEAPGRATLSRAFVRNRLGPQRALMTEAEQLLLGTQFSHGNGMMVRDFFTLGYGIARFASSAGTVDDTAGYAVAIATEDLEDMGDRGPSTFFVPTSALNFSPAHPPRLATPPAQSTPVAPDAASAGDADTVQPTAATPAPADTASLDGAASTGSHDTATSPVTTQPAAATPFDAPPPGATHDTVGMPHAPFAGPPPGMQLGDAGFNMSFAGAPRGGLPSPFPHYRQHARHHPSHGAMHGPPFGAAHGAGAFYGGHPGYPQSQFGTHAMDQQFQNLMGGQLPSPSGQSGLPNVGAPSPTQSFAARNPLPHAPATAKGGVTQLFSNVKPVDVVLADQYVPAVSDPVGFARNMRKELTAGNWDGQPMKHRVRQLLLNVEPSFRGLLEVKGAASMTDEALFAQLARDYPARLSVSSKIERLRAQSHCTNHENTVVHVADLITKYLAALGMEYVTDIQAECSPQHAVERFETLATLIMNSLPPDAQTVFRLNKAAMISACRGPTGLAALEAAIVAEYSARADNAANNKKAPSYLVTQDKHYSALVARINVLESEKNSDSSDTVDKKPKTRYKFDPKNIPFDAAKAKRPCRVCEHDPQSVGGLGPGMHWHYKCPFAEPSHGVGSDEE